jgi:hypothetical protein
VSAQHTPVQFGQTVGADFEASTMTLQMEPGYIVAVGPVAVLPLAAYDALLEALQECVESDLELSSFGQERLLGRCRAAIAKATT